jgi:CheY-like chemotaxis protein
MSAAEGKAQAGARVSNESKRVLIVEDNLMNRRLAGFMVKGKGLEFDACGSGAEALLQLKAKKYDLVLMDIEMPGMNGYECTHKIRKELKMDIPVVAMTAHDSEEEKSKCREMGMDGYISKPMDEHEFAKILERHLNQAA